VLALRLPDFDLGIMSVVSNLDREILRQATMVAYVDSYWLLFVMTLGMIPLILLMRSPPQIAGADRSPASAGEAMGQH
jgi:DHA2 family multidrug resistance protein